MTSKINPTEAILLASEEPCVKLIDCPDYPKDHQAVLYTFPHRFAGTWDCPTCDVTDTCEHTNIEQEENEITYWSNPDSDQSYNTKINVCADCGVEVIL